MWDIPAHAAVLPPILPRVRARYVGVGRTLQGDTCRKMLVRANILAKADQGIIVEGILS
jgi:hypothetical protein